MSPSLLLQLQPQDAVLFAAAGPPGGRHLTQLSSDNPMQQMRRRAAPSPHVLSLTLYVCVKVCRALGSKLAARYLAQQTTALPHSGGRLANAFFAVRVSPWGQDLATGTKFNAGLTTLFLSRSRVTVGSSVPCPPVPGLPSIPASWSHRAWHCRGRGEAVSQCVTRPPAARPGRPPRDTRRPTRSCCVK